MGGDKKRRQRESEQRSREAVTLERQRAQELHTELGQRKAALTGDIFGQEGSLAATRRGAEELRESGGYSPEELARIRGGYSEFAETGGFSPEQREQYLRRATAPTAAIYGTAQDELSRRAALQGGYTPGMAGGEGRLIRRTAQAGAEASLGANVELARQIREGRFAGLEGERAVEEGVARGRQVGQDALARYTALGVAALNQTDIVELQNRLQSGNISMADANLLAILAEQNKGLFDMIMEGVRTIGGAAAGTMIGIGGLRD